MKDQRAANTQTEEEFIGCLRLMMKEHVKLQSFRYFVNQMLRWYQKVRTGMCDSPVVILGSGIPEELVMAAGTPPLHILGGSRQSLDWSDDLVPRDTDPVSRSVLGYVKCLQKDPSQAGSRLFLIPAASDSMRKIAYQLQRDGEKVVVLDIPPDRKSETSRDKWAVQMEQMMEAVADHVHGRITSASLYRAVRQTSRARICLHEFSLMAPEHDRLLSASARILVQNSYYVTDDLETWTYRLYELMAELRHRSRTSSDRKDPSPRVLLLGSPIGFPNVKIPQLITESGLRLWRQADVFENIQYVIPKIGKDRRNLKKMIRTVSDTWYRLNLSPAYLINDEMRRRVRLLIASGQGEGMVVHVLKGQIEQDFELPFYEALSEEYRIPVFRLETDYQYQDVEQLRIRLEAFAEMLKHQKNAEQEAV